MSVAGQYQAAREIYPHANTLLSACSTIPDRDGLILMFNTYSTDIYDTAAHPDTQQWNGWDPFINNVRSIWEAFDKTVESVIGRTSDYFFGDSTSSVYSDGKTKYGDDVMDAYHKLDQLLLYYDNKIPVVSTLDTGANGIEQTVDDAGRAIGNATKGLGTEIGIGAALAVAGVLFLLYISAKHGGSVVP